MEITFKGISKKFVKLWRGALRINQVSPEPGDVVNVNITLSPGETLIVDHSMLIIAKEGFEFAIDRYDFREVEIL